MQLPPPVLRQDHNGLCTLILNRPEKLNALNNDMLEALYTEAKRLTEQTEEIGCVLLRGSGRCFSAGHDLGDIRDRGERTTETMRHESNVITQLANIPQPLIVAVHGHCYTGALELALAGDMIVAAQSARFADTHATWSLVPIWGMSQRLPRRIGDAKAREMMFTARTYSGEEAAVMGLANTCVADEDFDAELEKLTGQILAASWFSNREVKKLLRETENLSLAEGLNYEIDHWAGKGPDSSDRITSFKNRKKQP